MSRGYHMVSRLCESLRITRGSFYWHFKTVDDYRRALPEYWVETYLPELAEKAKQRAKSPEDRLTELGRAIRDAGAHLLDKAMRGWAESEPSVSRALKKAEAFRRTVVAEAAQAAGPEKSITPDQSTLLSMAWRSSGDQILLISVFNVP